jgi:hypothetical protein
LQILASNPVDEKFQDIRARAIAAYSPDFDSPDDITLDKHFPIAEPATVLKEVLENPPVKDLMEEALFHFGEAAKKLIELADAAIKQLEIN